MGWALTGTLDTYNVSIMIKDTMKEKSVSFYTLGCRLNQSETAVIQNSFESSGYRVLPFNQPADIVIVNTCTVTQASDADTRGLVHKINRLNPSARIALIGCQAQIQKKKLTELPNVKWVIGNAKKMDIASILNNIKDDDAPMVITPAIPRGSFTIPFAGIDRQHTRANIKIQDGCDFFCTFCEVPYARGRARSRRFNDILREAKILAASGHKELVITGINLGTYRDHDKNISDVIRALDKIEGLERVRVSSIEPTTIPEDILSLMLSGKSPENKLCRHLHIPLQSGDDRILKSMKRKYSVKEFSGFLHKAFEAIPGICIGTDIIVGFPGETEESFNATYDFLSRAPVHYFHVFSYSRRNMAKSQNLPDNVPSKTIQARSLALRELSQQKRYRYYQSLEGTVTQVLFEQKKGGCWTGLTDTYVRVMVKSSEHLENRLGTVKLIQATSRGVTGKILSREGILFA